MEDWATYLRYVRRFVSFWPLVLASWTRIKAISLFISVFLWLNSREYTFYFYKSKNNYASIVFLHPIFLLSSKKKPKDVRTWNFLLANKNNRNSLLINVARESTYVLQQESLSTEIYGREIFQRNKESCENDRSNSPNRRKYSSERFRGSRRKHSKSATISFVCATPEGPSRWNSALFSKTFPTGADGICVEFSAISSPFDAPRRSLDRVTASFPADLSNQRIVRVTPDHSLSLSPSLPAWLHSGKIIAAKSQFLDGARWSREKRREESCWNKRGLASLSFPSEKGWKQRGRGKQRARTAKTADVTCLFFTIEAHCS